MKYPS